MKRALALLFATLLSFTAAGNAQMPAPAETPAYQPKFAGDKAQSEAEAAALGYMRTVVSAQKVYKKKHGAYATSLASLVGSGSFTRRMTQTARGDYTVSFRGKPDGYSLILTPRQFDPQHRAFYVDQTGVYKVEQEKPATAASPVLK
jgi:hypothetical protein